MDAPAFGLRELPGTRDQINWRRNDQRIAYTPRFPRDVMVPILALSFSQPFMVYTRNAGQRFCV